MVVTQKTQKATIEFWLQTLMLDYSNVNNAGINATAYHLHQLIYALMRPMIN